MAVAEEQMELIPDLEPEDAKKLRSLIRKRNKLKDEAKTSRDSFKASEDDVREFVQGKVKPNGEGVYVVKSDGAVIKIAPGKAQLTIDEIEQDKPDEPDEEEVTEGAEQESRRGRVANRG